MKKLTKRQASQLAALRKMKDEDIDLSDIPEITDWSNAVVGQFYRPVKQSLTIRLDADVIAWLKSQGRGYQTRINSLLRNAMGSAPR
ncbi:MAG: BrnA antitoxin family protein [Bryobacteraceae bacterium]